MSVMADIEREWSRRLNLALLKIYHGTMGKSLNIGGSS